MTDSLKLRALRREAADYGGDSRLHYFLNKVDGDSTITDEVVRNLFGPTPEKEKRETCTLCWRTATTFRLVPPMPADGFLAHDNLPFCDHHARALDEIAAE